MSMLDERTRLRQSERTASRVVDGRAVVVVIDTQQLHTLSEVGSFVWERADGRSVGEIVDAIVGEFDVDRAQALADLERFTVDLSRLGALRVEPA
ncbi:MAG: PqqD family protein [Sandaracinaceae bacterium]|nr:PqqD family protein [Sandaracinaceae bacterium]